MSDVPYTPLVQEIGVKYIHKEFPDGKIDIKTDYFKDSVRKWDLRFLSLAKHVAQWSKDPSTKVGAVIVDQQNRIVGMGYNGFPRGFPDSDELYKDRDKKLARVVHAEMNAILNSNTSLNNSENGFTIYVWPLFSCASCAKHVAQTDINRVITPEIDPTLTRLASEYDVAQEIYKECHINVDHYRMSDIV